MIVLPEPIEFQWDRGNINKNLKKHGISDQECEEIFLDENKKILRDILHSDEEERYIILGQTKSRISLFAVFTVRENKVRLISVRKLNKKEYHLYEKTA